MALPEADWQRFCRTAAAAARTALARYTTTAERAVETGRGEGGDMTLAIDRAAEDAIFAELELLGVPLTAVSEERGEVAIGGGGPTRVVIDPVDGSLNAKRGLPYCAVSIAIASGPGMLDVEAGLVAELGSEREWWAARGEGAYLDGRPLELLTPGRLELIGLEGATPSRVAAAAGALRELEAHRVRVLGSVALSLCLVAAGQLDAMTSLRPMRSVDAAAAQLLVREAGGAVAFPTAGPDAALDLEMRSQVIAARDETTLHRLLAAKLC
ncbi:MAG TPA: inositol monophosphatase family protein [Thermoleophilaceae bacterium]